MNDELDDFVGEEVATVETTAESQEAVEVEQSTETVSEQDTSKGEESEPPSQTDKPQETMIPLAAKQAEKERRKQAEERARNAELELARLQGMQQASQRAEPESIPDPYTDPEAYTKYSLEQQSQQLQAQSQRALMARLASAEEVARVELEDYDTYAEHFATKVAPNNPQLVEMMKASPDPAKFAYYKGKQHMQEVEIKNQIEQAGGLEAYTKAIQERAVAEALAQQQKPESPKIPPDLTSVRNAGGEPIGDDIADGTDGLNQLLGR